MTSWTRWGPVYWHGGLYRGAMRLLRGAAHAQTYRSAARETGGLSTLELCCGEGELERSLGGADYRGIDLNPAFVASARRRGLRVEQGDVLIAPWPAADCLVIIDSLYHFLPDADAFMAKALAHPFKRFVVSESVTHVASDPRPWVAALAAWATRVDGRDVTARFDEPGLLALLRRHGFQRMRREGANVIGVLER